MRRSRYQVRFIDVIFQSYIDAQPYRYLEEGHTRLGRHLAQKAFYQLVSVRQQPSVLPSNNYTDYILRSELDIRFPTNRMPLPSTINENIGIFFDEHLKAMFPAVAVVTGKGRGGGRASGFVNGPTMHLWINVDMEAVGSGLPRLCYTILTFLYYSLCFALAVMLLRS